MKNEHNLLIIGGGLVGMYAASLAKIKGLNPLIIEASNEMGGQPVSLYPQKEIVDLPSYQSIVGKDIVHNHLQQLHLWLKNDEIMLNTQLVHFSYVDNLINCELSNQETIQVKYLVLATGNGFFSPNLLEIDGAKDHPNIHYSLSSVSNINNKKILILGGGDSAVDLANNLAKTTNNHITIIHRRDQFRANGENVNQMSSNHIQIILNALCQRIENNKLFYLDKISNIEKSIEFDEILVQYGQKYNNNLREVVPSLKVDEVNRFVVDNNQQTNLKNVFAVGNCCNYPHRPNLISLGYGEVARAIMYIADIEHDYH